MEQPVQLPQDLVDRILCRVPIKSLARFRSLCKEWSVIWENKTFLNNYFAHARPRFILYTESKTYSVDINLNLDIKLHDMTYDNIPYEDDDIINIVHCHGFLLCNYNCDKMLALWNPLLKQSRQIVSEVNDDFRFCGVGHDEKGYCKIFGYCIRFDASRKLNPKVAIYECNYDAWRFIYPPSEDWRVPQLDTIASLNSNLYWIAYDSNTSGYFIRTFDFEKEEFKTFCPIPRNQDLCYTQILAVFKGDRFSILKQSYMTRKIEILVTKEKIGRGEDVTWMSFMTVSIPNLPMLQDPHVESQPSYFVDNTDDKRLFACACDETGQACIYIVKGDVFRKIQIHSSVDSWPSHLTYIPTFVSIPKLQRHE